MSVFALESEQNLCENERMQELKSKIESYHARHFTTYQNQQHVFYTGINVFIQAKFIRTSFIMTGFRKTFSTALMQL
jgi:hypothetical protein